MLSKTVCKKCISRHWFAIEGNIIKWNENNWEEHTDDEKWDELGYVNCPHEIVGRVENRFSVTTVPEHCKYQLEHEILTQEIEND